MRVKVISAFSDHIKNGSCINNLNNVRECDAVNVCGSPKDQVYTCSWNNCARFPKIHVDCKRKIGPDTR